jgi:ATP-dependent DNA helicase DinG
MRQLIASIDENRRYGAQAPTGSGKSFAYLSAIASEVITEGRKAVVSTETRQLQAQVVTKDLPAINQAAREVAGRGITYAALKGRQNYICLYALLAELGIQTENALPLSTINGILQANNTNPLHVWLANHVADGKWNGAIEDIPVGKSISTDDIDAMTVGSQECLGTKCPFNKEGGCYADAAVEAALNADVIVTNHALVAIELVTGAPIVLRRGERKADIVVIDEAHSLESVVRSQESILINPVSIGYALRQAVAAKASLPRDKLTSAERAIVEFQRSLATSSTVKVNPSTYHRSNVKFHARLDVVTIKLIRAIEAVQRGLPENSLSPKVIKARTRLGGVIASLNAFLSITEDQQSAVWIEERTENEYVMVIQSIQLSTRLWAALNERTGDGDDKQENDDEEPGHKAAIAAVSATLPEITARNLLGRNQDYEAFSSPFTLAYQQSKVLIPCDTTPMPGGRFNHTVHQEWAASVISDLVIANGGSALILSTSASGALYFYEELKKSLPSSVPLVFYKDGSSKAVVDGWKSERKAVLVATRGMMTGVDAPGLTCTLVVIDRVPRAPSSITNELRVESLLQSGGKQTVSRYIAEAGVYGGDASVLLEQAAGRLIRSEGDSGLLAVLDPRLCRKQSFSYRAPYLKYYRAALGSWGEELNNVEEAVSFLESRTNYGS